MSYSLPLLPSLPPSLLVCLPPTLPLFLPPSPAIPLHLFLPTLPQTLLVTSITFYPIILRATDHFHYIFSFLSPSPLLCLSFLCSILFPFYTSPFWHTLSLSFSPPPACPFPLPRPCRIPAECMIIQRIPFLLPRPLT